LKKVAQSTGRKVGIVAVARKLANALWRFIEQGVIPEWATLKTRRQKSYYELAASAIKWPTTGKTDRSSQPGSSLVRLPRLLIPAYVNSDYDARAARSTGYKSMRLGVHGHDRRENGQGSRPPLLSSAACTKRREPVGRTQRVAEGRAENDR